MGVPLFEEAVHDVVVDDGVRGHKGLGDHVVFELNCLLNLAIVDKTLGEDSVCGGRGRKGGVVLEKKPEVLEGDVGLAAVAVGLEEEIDGDDVGGDTGLGDEPVEGEKIGIAALAEESVEDRVDGEDGGAAVGVDGMAGEERGLVEVVLADEFEDAVVEVEAFGDERGNGLRQLGGVGVGRGPRASGRSGGGGGLTLVAE